MMVEASGPKSLALGSVGCGGRTRTDRSGLGVWWGPGEPSPFSCSLFLTRNPASTEQGRAGREAGSSARRRPGRPGQRDRERRG